MKKITLLVASIFVFGGSVANATEKKDFSVIIKSSSLFDNDEPVEFIERGIAFYVFPDGQLDFNTRPTTRGEMYYKANSNSRVNRTYGTPNRNRPINYGVRIEHDNLGRVRQVGNVFINYDANDRVKRIGSVYMTYNRFALERVGGLEIIYNRRGQVIDMIGSVKGGKAYYYGQNSNSVDYSNNQDSSDEDSYYYRSTNSKNKIEDQKSNNAPIVINRKN
ncbi:hypothetical protein FVB9288_03413 [Flavobacterium sp. CECT 9288]|uniref:hypothetical protein n=1 Tax=Flavobacterium sp. CECT 9288 TaxID=2845819 RepID=UPI001E57F486|nr:hypothetical protein [Flavobacterium sp. CECT 9288]CAH0334424.1 hypothetical protein FVB9288_00004 [Flavobacterium sp. CECT 9288]CAH0337641.1 hypothetical protein FVB9288_03413 [Flavobacterium sp. CECT 9288]